MQPHSESPARADAILRALRGEGDAQVLAPRPYSLEPILAVHDRQYLEYLEHVYAAWVRAGLSEVGVLPEAFAGRPGLTKPRELIWQSGYYCFDAGTPIGRDTYDAALAAAACALTGADLLLEGQASAYALCRPPGHHAGRRYYGGYCYLNNAAIAATRLRDAARGRIAIVDFDFHHGNGTQDIFYRSEKVLVVSIHADPNEEYPFYCGYADEQGEGAGHGYHHNFPLPAGVNDEKYLAVLQRAVEIIRDGRPAFLVVSIGADIHRDDPQGEFDLSSEAFVRIGQCIAQVDRPTLFVQEGGYNLDQIGPAVVNTLRGFKAGQS